MMDSRAEPIERLYPDPALGPYRLRLWIGDVSGRPGVVGVEMWGIEPQSAGWHDRHLRATSAGAEDDPAVFDTIASAPDTAITASAIRLPLGAFLDGWVQQNQALVRAAVQILTDRVRVTQYLAGLGEPTRGRPPLPDDVVRLVAQLYRAAELAGDRAPARAVERELHRRWGYPKSKGAATVRSWIRLARERGYLPPPRRTK